MFFACPFAKKYLLIASVYQGRVKHLSKEASSTSSCYYIANAIYHTIYCYSHKCDHSTKRKNRLDTYIHIHKLVVSRKCGRILHFDLNFTQNEPRICNPVRYNELRQVLRITDRIKSYKNRITGIKFPNSNRLQEKLILF